MSWKEQDRQAEDETAHIYDYLYNRTHFAHTMYGQFAQEIASKVKGGRVLELACGTGTVSQLVKQLSPSVETYGIDHSPRMIEIARAKIDHCQVGDIESLPYESGFFDAVYVHSALHHFPSLEQVIKEARRVLKPGCLFFVQEPNKHDIRISGLVRACRFIARQFVKTYPDVSHLEINPSEHHDTITMGRVTGSLDAAGLSVTAKQYRYYASWLLGGFDSMALHRIGLALDSYYVHKFNDGYMFFVAARKA